MRRGIAPRLRAEAGLSPAQQMCGVRPGAGERRARSAYLHGLPQPDVVSARVVGSGADAICEIGLADYGTVRMPVADVGYYRKFHAHCMENLFLVFGWVDAGGWNYRLLHAMCETARQDAEGGP